MTTGGEGLCPFQSGGLGLLHSPPFSGRRFWSSMGAGVWGGTDLGTVLN